MLVWLLNVARWAKCFVRYSRVLSRSQQKNPCYIFYVLIFFSSLSLSIWKGQSLPEVRGWQLFDDPLNVQKSLMFPLNADHSLHVDQADVRRRSHIFNLVKTRDQENALLHPWLSFERFWSFWKMAFTFAIVKQPLKHRCGSNIQACGLQSNWMNLCSPWLD